MKNEMSDLPAPLQAHVRGVIAGITQLARSAFCAGISRQDIVRILTEEQFEAEKGAAPDRVQELLHANNNYVDLYRKWRSWALRFKAVADLSFSGETVVAAFKEAQAKDPDLCCGDIITPLHAAPSWRQPVTLEECPPGLFDYRGELCMKTEYRISNEDLRCQAYIVASGEFFCGEKGVGQRETLVVPVSIPAFWAQAQNAGTVMGREFRPTHRHRKRGSSYELITDKAPYQESQPGERPPYDDEPMAVYRAEDGEIYVRRAEGFNSGRFERL